MRLSPEYWRQVGRSVSWRMTPSGRRRLALEHAKLHTRAVEPGLDNVDREGYVESHGKDIAYYVGTEPTHPQATVVFIHGFTLSAESYFLQAKHLRRHWPQVRSLLMDLRGHGRTGTTPVQECSVDYAADDVIASIRHCAQDDSPIILVGHSLGGLVAFAVLRRMSEHERQRVAGMVLVSTSIDALAARGLPQLLKTPVAEKVRSAMETSPEEAAQLRQEAAGILAPALAATVFRRPTNYNLIEFHAAMINETPLETFIGFLDDLQDHQEDQAAPYLRDIRGRIMVGDKDGVTPISQARRIKELWPQARLDVVHDAGHMIILEAPEAVNTALDGLLGVTVQRRR